MDLEHAAVKAFLMLAGRETICFAVLQRILLLPGDADRLIGSVFPDQISMLLLFNGRI